MMNNKKLKLILFLAVTILKSAKTLNQETSFRLKDQKCETTTLSKNCLECKIENSKEICIKCNTPNQVPVKTEGCISCTNFISQIQDHYCKSCNTGGCSQCEEGYKLVFGLKFPYSNLKYCTEKSKPKVGKKTKGTPWAMYLSIGVIVIVVLIFWCLPSKEKYGHEVEGDDEFLDDSYYHNRQMEAKPGFENPQMEGPAF